MKDCILFSALMILLFGCAKRVESDVDACNVNQALAANEWKVSITQGVYGTVSFMEGNCMPPVTPGEGQCKNCVVQRTVRIYAYTTQANAVPAGSAGFYQSFSTQLIREVQTDALGFFQVSLPAGNYTMVVLEDGKMYANITDGQGGINSFTVASGNTKRDLSITYKASF